MREWTVSEIDTLVAMWSTASAAQIAKRLHRPTGAISGKASRLRREGVLPAGGVAKQYDANPWPSHAKPKPTIKPANPAAILLHGAAKGSAPLAMQPCTLVELDAGRCHWPLGDIEAVATMFCGGDAAPGRCYCAHHLRRAARS